MIIDWSKAPEGATHWAPATDRLSSSFMKHEGGEWFCESANGNRWVKDESDDQPSRYIARPVGWTGQGEIQVGMICRLGGKPFTLIAVHDGYAWLKTDDNGFQTAKLFKLEPLKTLQEIAAEKRQAQIDQMLTDAGIADSAFSGDPEAEAWAAALLDAGYRKVEGGAA